ncbi:MAG: hypothetical protein Q7J65_07445, partial [Candidatus Marinimicrobia bacterium]|nr:hypothetical protein [Candidatus Neomarinimicrobiota bacterium]
MQEPLTVGKLYHENRKVFKLKRYNETVGFNRVVTSSRLNRPGLELTGFWKYFDKSRIQIIGRKEKMYFRTLPDDERQKVLKKLSASGTPAIIFAHGARPPEFSLEIARENNIALFSTPMLTSNLVGRLMDYLDWNLAP